MTYEEIADTLFVEISVFTTLLTAFMLYNNIVLYKMSFKDKLSIMLVSATVLSAFDGIWHFVDGNPTYKILNYACAYIFAIAMMLGSSMFTRFSLNQFEIKMSSKKLHYVLFIAPTVLTVILCLTTPWTGLVYSIDEHGEIQYGIIFDYCLVPIAFMYASSPLLQSIYYLIRRRKSNAEKKFYAQCILITSLLIAGIEFIQLFVLELDENYLETSLSTAIALTFFTTNVNTNRFVKNREKIVAVETDLNLAANIQTGSLPSAEGALVNHPDVNIYATMDTAKEVGGDFYDFFEIDGTHIAFVIADISGKGVPAALFSMTVKTMIKDHASMKLSTAQIFTDVNRILCESNPEEMFATAWIGILDTKTRIMKFTNAGHNAPCFARKAENFEFLKNKHGLFLAGMDDTQYKESEIQLQDGDSLLIYTDGLTEAHNGSGELYGEERLLKKLNSADVRGGKAFLTQIKEDLQAFVGDAEQFDDITMLSISLR